MKALNKSYKVPKEEKYGVFKKIITKLTYYFFTIIDLGTASFGNDPSFIQQKVIFPLIKCSGPMCIDFYEYPRYSGRNSVSFEKYVNENIKCDHGYAYSSSKHKMCTWVNAETWEMMKNCFPDEKQIKNCPKTVLCKECTYVQKRYKWKR